jgi:hypothetical protein
MIWTHERLLLHDSLPEQEIFCTAMLEQFSLLLIGERSEVRFF